MSSKNFKDQINEYRTKYDSVGRVWCKVLNDHVYFTSEGKNHLLYKENRKKRNEVEQKYKLRLFPLVIPIIKSAKDIKGWRFSNESEHSDVQHYALVSTAGKTPARVRVIIKRTGDGQFNFHSVMLDGDNTKKSRVKRDS